MCKINKWTCFNVITGCLHNHVLFSSHIKWEIYGYRRNNSTKWLTHINRYCLQTIKSTGMPSSFHDKVTIISDWWKEAPGNNHTRENKVVRYRDKSPVTGHCVITFVVPDILKDCGALTFSGQHTQSFRTLRSTHPTTERHMSDDLGLQQHSCKNLASRILSYTVCLFSLFCSSTKCWNIITVLPDRQMNKETSTYEGWNVNSGNYLFTTDTK